MAELLRYAHVEIQYRCGALAVQDMNFSVEEGEILGIVGESGSGKSTVLRAAMGLLGQDGRVTKGGIFYQGTDLLRLSPKELRAVCGRELGMVFQNAGAAFCPVRTVEQQLLEAVRAHEAITRTELRKRAEELLSRFGFSDPVRVLHSYPSELSGGMQQRVGIAAAMLLHPKVLLADEPTSALDVYAQKQVLEEMQRVRDTFGTAILLVTHHLGVVRAMADQILVLKQGKTVEYGAAQSVLEAPQSAYTRQLLAAVPVLRR